MIQLFKQLLLLTLLLLPLCSCANENIKKSLIHITQGKYSNYYHMTFTLNNSNFEFSSDENGLNYTNYTDELLTDAGGIFEILIPVEKFPIKSEKCKRHIKARMPWSDTSNKRQAAGLESKILLFNKLKNTKNIKQGEVNVTFELNPYIKTSATSAHGVILTGCNVFFRHAHGQYIDYVGKLNPIE